MGHACSLALSFLDIATNRAEVAVYDVRARDPQEQESCPKEGRNRTLRNRKEKYTPAPAASW